MEKHQYTMITFLAYWTLTNGFLYLDWIYSINHFLELIYSPITFEAYPLNISLKQTEIYNISFLTYRPCAAVYHTNHLHLIMNFQTSQQPPTIWSRTGKTDNVA